MEVVATNLGGTKQVYYKGQTVVTGIYKYPVEEGVFLESEDVRGDTVVDRVDHAGIDKACYLYSSNAYEYWKPMYPNLDWSYGMFGENITIKGLDELSLKVGAKYQIGEAIIQIAQPRQPCYKQGIRMGTQSIIKQFINTTFSGAYVRVLQNGWVKPGNTLTLISEPINEPTIAEAFYCLYQPELKRSVLDKIFASEYLAESCKKDIQRRLKE